MELDDSKMMAEGAGFEPARPCGRWISSPLPYQLGLTLRGGAANSLQLTADSQPPAVRGRPIIAEALAAVRGRWTADIGPSCGPILISNVGGQMQEKSCEEACLDNGSSRIYDNTDDCNLRFYASTGQWLVFGWPCYESVPLPSGSIRSPSR